MHSPHFFRPSIDRLTGTNILINQARVTRNLPSSFLATRLRFSGLVAFWQLERLRKAVHLQQTQTDISAFSADASFLPLPVLYDTGLRAKKDPSSRLLFPRVFRPGALFQVRRQ
jgi:hypothetical protein